MVEMNNEFQDVNEVRAQIYSSVDSTYIGYVKINETEGDDYNVTIFLSEQILTLLGEDSELQCSLLLA